MQPLRHVCSDKKTTFLGGLQHRRQPCCASQQGGETVQRRSLAGSQPIAGAGPVLESVLNNRLPTQILNTDTLIPFTKNTFIEYSYVIYTKSELDLNLTKILSL